MLFPPPWCCVTWRLLQVEVKGGRSFNWVDSCLKPVFNTLIWTPLKTPELFTDRLPPLGSFHSWNCGQRAFWPLFRTKRCFLLESVIRREQRTWGDFKILPQSEPLAFRLIDFSRHSFRPSGISRLSTDTAHLQLPDGRIDRPWSAEESKTNTVWRWRDKTTGIHLKQMLPLKLEAKPD